jgi:hypothetical protein
MLESNLANVGVLILANQCWDRSLTRLAVAKAAAELPLGALVIEYTGAMRSAKCMQLVACTCAPVSWKKDGILFHVWVKRGEGQE